MHPCSPLLPLSACPVYVTSQLQDAAKNKFSKCEHIDLDWGVGGDADDEIYQIPLTPTNVDHQASLLAPMRRSDTSGNISDKKGELNVFVDVI